ncbi:unnamed protein product, partial [Mesorhabditis belari]|uniref:Protein-lysine N-methyltransferase n=1 Tax=Mesorhabditis belari TaxID=2138241 RepID=A0AAF3FCN1_9BILA
MPDDQIAASILGTKDFWDNHYNQELKNFKEHHDNQGEIWFGKSAENRILKYFDAKNIPKTQQIIDFGCGNGSLLRRLFSKGYGNLFGVDYSLASIELSKKIAEDVKAKVDFQVLDLLAPSQEQFRGQFDIVLDKGTLDALLLCELDERQNRLKAYVSSVIRALESSGKFIVVSCNFTRDELVDMLTPLGLQFEEELPNQSTFTFGGKVGNTTTAAVFSRTCL